MALAAAMTEGGGRWVKIEQRRPVGWFDLRQLARTGFMTAMSTVIGSMTGRRELLAALDIGRRGPDPEPYRYDGQPDSSHTNELWVDYVADTGDGWNATHSISWLVGRGWLFLGEPGRRTAQPVTGDALQEAQRDSVDSAYSLPRGDILILGGDEVYPAADAAEYKARLHDPFFAARPWATAASTHDATAGAADLYAIPGNHDWYDGLTSFIRVFCQASYTRWIGSWRPRQHRSYFSLKLPHGFWIWGIDTALEEDVDPPQIDYFRKQAQHLGEMDQVILCAPTPAWIELDAENQTDKSASAAWIRLEQLINIVTHCGAKVPVLVAGNMHHYARHELDDDERHFITCGGGGAFAVGTGVQPEKLLMPSGKTAMRAKRAFPNDSDSEKLKWRALWMFKSSVGFCLLLAAFQVLLIWLMQKNSQLLLLYERGGLPFGGIEMTWLERLATTARMPMEIAQLFADALTIIQRSPSVIFLLVILTGLFVAFSISGAKPRMHASIMPVVGIVHVFVQISVAWAVCAVVVAVAQPIELESITGAIIITALLLGTLWVICGLLLGIYLLTTNRYLGAHEQEVYSCQAIEDWKSFLRMHVSDEGLTIYPVGLRYCVRNWQLAGGIKRKGPTGITRNLLRSVAIKRSDTVWVPDGTTHIYEPSIDICPELIDDPIVVPRSPASGDS